MKFLAFYLPQYHSITENDQWWGKGFTEWIRVKNAVPLFEGHYQPRIPNEYYDLSEVEVMVRQSRLAKEYGIYGFCYYHYWFNGKLLLEKPLEQMLNCRYVDIPFCLSWANEKWTRAWEGRSKEILMDQEYGDENEWQEHLTYLIPYFKDPRYIKIEDCPVLLIYRTESYPGFDRMITFWNKKLKESGLSKLYIIEMLTSYQKVPLCKNSQGVLEFEPMFTIGDSISFKSKLKSILLKRYSFFTGQYYKIFDYDKIWRKILNRKSIYSGRAVFKGAFTDWDNTPRFKDKSTFFRNVSPTKFFYYLLQHAKQSETDFIFINAWNEWAEGAYLEPDKKYGVEYLESIKRVSEKL
jgi:hypothetical protein